MHHSKICVAPLLAGAWLLAAPVAAAPVKLLGLNDMSCVAWKATKFEPEGREPYIQWVRGFLSGHNYANQAKQVAEVSSGTVGVFIDRYCAEHAAATVAEAAMRMSDQYSGRNAPITR
jgi:ABC-type tungstate transport system permease subunit